MTRKTQNDRYLVKDISSASSAFSQVAGILGGFSVTLVVLALSPGVISSNFGKDCVIGFILSSAALYIYSSSYFANAISYKYTTNKTSIYYLALDCFHLSNLFLSIGLLSFIISISQFSLVISIIVAGLNILCAVGTALYNRTLRKPSSLAFTETLGLAAACRRPLPLELRDNLTIPIADLLEERFGTLDEELYGLVEQIAKLPISQRNQLLLSLANLSREQLLEKVTLMVKSGDRR